MGELKENNTVIRVVKQNNYVVMNKGFLEDNRLSFKAKGILAYLLSKPDDWKVMIEDLIDASTEGKSAIYAGLNELKAYGYYEKLPVRADNGRTIDHWESVVYEVPREPEVKKPQRKQKEVIHKVVKNPVDKPVDKYDFSVDKDVDKMCISKVNPLSTSRFSKSRKPGQLLNNNITNNNISCHVMSNSNIYGSNILYRLMGLDETVDRIDFEVVRKFILTKIDYLSCVLDFGDRRLVDEFVNVMIDNLLSETQQIRINGEAKSMDAVKSVLCSLGYTNIIYALNKFVNTREQIKNKKRYILSLLYNSAFESQSSIWNDMSSRC